MPYTGRLDDTQFEWLKQQLAQSDPERPVAILSHIPILSAGELLDGDNEASGNWLVPGAWVHIDARRLVELFHQHPNVRLCLSGHSHQHERLEYLGVTYVGGGAICGKWWMGDYMHFPPGYVPARPGPRRDLPEPVCGLQRPGLMPALDPPGLPLPPHTPSAYTPSMNPGTPGRHPGASPALPALRGSRGAPHPQDHSPLTSRDIHCIFTV